MKAKILHYSALKTYEIIVPSQTEDFLILVEQFLPNPIPHHIKLNLHLESGAKLNLISLIQTSGPINLNLDIQLQEFSELTLYHLELVEAQANLNTVINIQHLAHHSTSQVLGKTEVGDAGKANFLGKIHISELGHQSKASLQHRTLLTSPTSKASSKPELEILNQDVECRHGSTIQGLAEDKIFYLNTKSLNLEQAKSALIQAFRQEILSQVPPNLSYVATQFFS